MIDLYIINYHMLRKNGCLIRSARPVAADSHIKNEILWEVEGESLYFRPVKEKELLFVDKPS